MTKTVCVLNLSKAACAEALIEAVGAETYRCLVLTQTDAGDSQQSQRFRRRTSVSGGPETNNCAALVPDGLAAREHVACSSLKRVGSGPHGFKVFYIHRDGQECCITADALVILLPLSGARTLNVSFGSDTSHECQQLPFMDQDLVKVLCSTAFPTVAPEQGPRGRPQAGSQQRTVALYRNLLPPRVNNLVFMPPLAGGPNDGPDTQLHRLRAQWVAAVLAGRLALPTPEQMEAEAAEEVLILAQCDHRPRVPWGTRLLQRLCLTPHVPCPYSQRLKQDLKLALPPAPASVSSRPQQQPQGFTVQAPMPFHLPLTPSSGRSGAASGRSSMDVQVRGANGKRSLDQQARAGSARRILDLQVRGPNGLRSLGLHVRATSCKGSLDPEPQGANSGTNCGSDALANLARTGAKPLCAPCTVVPLPLAALKTSRTYSPGAPAEPLEQHRGSPLVAAAERALLEATRLRMQCHGHAPRPAASAAAAATATAVTTVTVAVGAVWTAAAPVAMQFAAATGAPVEAAVPQILQPAVFEVEAETVALSQEEALGTAAATAGANATAAAAGAARDSTQLPAGSQRLSLDHWYADSCFNTTAAQAAVAPTLSAAATPLADAEPRTSATLRLLPLRVGEAHTGDGAYCRPDAPALYTVYEGLALQDGFSAASHPGSAGNSASVNLQPLACRVSLDATAIGGKSDERSPSPRYRPQLWPAGSDWGGHGHRARRTDSGTAALCSPRQQSLRQLDSSCSRQQLQAAVVSMMRPGSTVISEDATAVFLRQLGVLDSQVDDLRRQGTTLAGGLLSSCEPQPLHSASGLGMSGAHAAFQSPQAEQLQSPVPTVRCEQYAQLTVGGAAFRFDLGAQAGLLRAKR